MTKKKFYDLLEYPLGQSPSVHPGRFEIKDVKTKGGMRMHLILILKTGFELCIDKRYPAHLMGEQYEAKMTLESLQKKYQRWYDKWLAEKMEE